MSCVWAFFHIYKDLNGVCKHADMTWEDVSAKGNYQAVKWEDETSLGILLCWCAITPVSPRLQVTEAIVGVVQNCPLIRCLLPANIDLHLQQNKSRPCSAQWAKQRCDHSRRAESAHCKTGQHLRSRKLSGRLDAQEKTKPESQKWGGQI